MSIAKITYFDMLPNQKVQLDINLAQILQNLACIRSLTSEIAVDIENI